MTDEMLCTNVDAANREGHRIQGNSFVETTMCEMRAFVGLLYF